MHSVCWSYSGDKTDLIFLISALSAEWKRGLGIFIHKCSERKSSSVVSAWLLLHILILIHCNFVIVSVRKSDILIAISKLLDEL